MPNTIQYNTKCTENVKISYTLVKKEDGERKRIKLRYPNKTHH